MKRFSEEYDNVRLTDCCGAFSTYNEFGELYCKSCFNGVSAGEGDGTEYKGNVHKEPVVLKVCESPVEGATVEIVPFDPFPH